MNTHWPQAALRVLAMALSILSAWGDIVLLTDSRQLETGSAAPKVAGFDDAFEASLESVFAPGGKPVALEFARQKSGPFHGARWVFDGEARANSLDGAVHGAWGRSSISLEFQVTEATGFSLKGTTRGASRTYTLFRLNGPTGSNDPEIRIGGNEELETSGTLKPGKYLLEASSYARAASNLELEQASFHFELEFDLPAQISVTPVPVDFGTVKIREERERSVRIANVGGTRTLLQVWIQQPNDPYFNLTHPPPPVLQIPGGTFVDVGIRLKVSGNPAVYESELMATLPVDSNGARLPHLNIPLRAFVRGPEPVSFTKSGSCVSLLSTTLEAQLAWLSSTGWRSDLEGVEIREILLPTEGWIPSEGNTVSAPAPWVRSMPATWTERSRWKGDERTVSLCPVFPPPVEFGAGLDTHGPFSWRQPLQEAAFRIEQVYQWRAPWKPDWTDLLHDTISRRIYQGAVFWHYEVASMYAGSSTATLGVSPSLRISASRSPTGESVTLDAVGTPGSTYAIRRAGSLDGPWETVREVVVETPGDGSFRFTDTDPPPGNVLYQLRELVTDQ